MHPTIRHRTGAALLGIVALSACAEGLDMDMRDFGNGFDTTEAAAAARGAPRPEPDARGIISYPTYQVAVARTGDTVSTVAARIGLPPAELASYNGLPETTPLRPGELVALPRRVGGTAVPGDVTTTPLGDPGDVRVAGLAAPAIDRAEAQQAAGDEPRRHRVETGETAFSIARRYGVSADALAEWNGLGDDRAVRVGQFLLIPPATGGAANVAGAERPGQGSVTPVPPSAAQPLPQEDVAREVETPAAPDMSASETAASDTTRLLTPVAGSSSIVRPYRKGRNDGIDIAAAPGAAVRAADAGTVAAITRDTDGVPIVVVRHQGDLLTVYAGVDDLRVEKGQQVTRGQQIAAIRAADPAILHFEVRQGFDSVDPAPFLN